jgi:hypothetical protein
MQILQLFPFFQTTTFLLIHKDLYLGLYIINHERDVEGEEIAAINEQSICDLMDIWFIGQEFWEKYTTSFFLLETEGNGSRPAVHGTLAAGQDTAKVATKKVCRAAKAKKAS